MQRKLTVILFVATFFPALALGQTLGNYESLTGQCDAVQKGNLSLTDEDFKEPGTAEILKQRVDNLCASLEAGAKADVWGITDDTAFHQSLALTDLTFRISTEVLAKTSEARKARSEAEGLAIAAREEAETGVLLSQPFELGPSSRESFTDFLLDQSQSCVVRLQAVRANPDSSSRFAKFNVTATAAPAGGTFVWGFIRASFVDELMIEDARVIKGGDTGFEGITDQITGEGLPPQTNDLAVLIQRQIVKEVGLGGRGGEEREARFVQIAVAYTAPSGETCYDQMSFGFFQSVTGVTFASSLDQKELDKLKELGFPFNN